VFGQSRQAVQGERRLVREARPGEIAVFHLRPVPEVKKFAAKYRAKYGKEPPPIEDEGSEKK
jgi:hypothetical protein